MALGRDACDIFSMSRGFLRSGIANSHLSTYRVAAWRSGRDMYHDISYAASYHLLRYAFLS